MNSASDHEVRRIAEGTGDIIVSVDRAGTITYASPAIRTFGYAPGDLVGQTGLAFVHPKDRGRFAENTAALLRGELIAGTDRQHRFRRADGRWAWVEGAAAAAGRNRRTVGVRERAARRHSPPPGGGRAPREPGALQADRRELAGHHPPNRSPRADGVRFAGGPRLWLRAGRPPRTPAGRARPRGRP